MWFFKELNTELPCDLAIPLQYIYPKEMKIYILAKTRTQIFIAGFFITVKRQNNLSVHQPMTTSTDECINKLWYIQTMEYYSALKQIKHWHMLQHGRTLKNMLSKISKTEKAAYCTLLFIWNKISIGKSMETN